MSNKINFKKTFNDLVTAYANWDETTQEKLIQQFKNSENIFRVEVEDDVQWDESTIEGFSEAPTVIQTYKIFFGNELVYEGERWYGKELIDPTHTGLGGRSEVIRVDEGGSDPALEILSEFKIFVDEPDVPDWK
jgi:hypothetical protein